MGRPGKYGRILLWLFCFCLVANGLWAAGVSDSDTFKIFFGETKVLTGEDINRVLSSDSTIVSARLRSDSELEILGNALGTTFVSYWDKTGRHTFRVIVSQMITEPYARPKEDRKSVV